MFSIANNKTILVLISFKIYTNSRSCLCFPELYSLFSTGTNSKFERSIWWAQHLSLFNEFLSSFDELLAYCFVFMFSVMNLYYFYKTLLINPHFLWILMLYLWLLLLLYFMLWKLIFYFDLNSKNTRKTIFVLTVFKKIKLFYYKTAV